MVRLVTHLLGIALVVMPTLLVAQETIEIAELERDEPVDFGRDVLPILRKSCLACHNESDAESDLVLESAEDILRGGSLGPAVEAGNPEDSLLLLVSSHEVDPIMPPEENDVEAPNMTPEELGLIKLWIEQGAMPSSLEANAVTFEPLPQGLNPVYALAISQDGQYLAAGRANQVFVYHLPSQREVTRLTDRQLIEDGIYENAGVAHLDLVQSIAMSPDGQRMATGGYRTVKLWQRSQTHVVRSVGVDEPIVSISTSHDGGLVAMGTASGHIMIADPGKESVQTKWKAHEGAVTGVAFDASGRVLSTSADKSIKRWDPTNGAPAGESIVMAQPATSMMVAVDGASIVVGTADNKLLVWATSLLDREPATTEQDSGDETVEAEGQDQEAETGVSQNTDVDSTPISPEKELAGHSQPVHRLRRFDANGSLVLSVSNDGTARVWSIAEAKVVRQFNHGAPITDAALSGDMTRLVTCSSNKTIKIWDAQNGNQLHELKGDLNLSINDEVAQRELSLSQRHVQLAKTDLDEANKRKTAEEENLKKAEEALAAATTAHAEKKQASEQAVAAKENADAELVKAKERLTNAQSRLETANTKLAESNAALQQAQTAMNQVKTESDALTTQFRASLGEVEPLRQSLDKDPLNQELLTQLQAKLSAVAELTEKQVVASQQLGTAESTLKTAMEAQVQATTEKEAADKEMAEAQAAVPTAEKAATDLAGPATTAMNEFTTAERNLASSQRTSDRAKVSVQNATDVIPSFEAAVTSAEETQAAAQQTKEETASGLGQAEQAFKSVAIDERLGVVFSVDETGRLQSWDLASGAPIESNKLVEGALDFLIVTPDGHVTALATDRMVVVSPGGEWSLMQSIGEPDGESPFTDRVTALDFDPLGNRLAIGGGDPSRSGEIVIYDIAEQTIERTIEEPHSDTVWCVRFSPDGSKIATSAADRFVKVFDVESGEFVRAFEGHTHHVLSVGWSADGRQLASSSADKSVKIWNSLTGDQVRTITGFGKEVTGIEFVSLENQVAVSCGDKSVQIKRADNGGNVRGFGGFSDFVFCVDVSDNGRYIAAGGQDSVVRVWTNDGKLFAELKSE